MTSLAHLAALTGNRVRAYRKHLGSDANPHHVRIHATRWRVVRTETGAVLGAASSAERAQQQCDVINTYERIAHVVARVSR